MRSRTSSFAIKGRPRNIRDAGQQLQADYILEGSVLRAGQQLRINVQLVRVRDDFPLWSGRYDRELTDIFAIQDDISVGIVNNLRLKLGRGRRRYETSVEAYDLYLHARALPQRISRDARASRRFVPAGNRERRLVRAGLCGSGGGVRCQFVSRFFDDHADELMQMRTAAEKAIRLDPLLAEAHQALGMVYARDGQWAQSEKSFRRAIELEPSNSLAYSDLTLNLLLPLGRIEEGVHEMRIAEKTDPLSPSVQSGLASALLSAGRYEEAAGHCQKAADTRCLGRARLGQGRIDEAIQILATGESAIPRLRLRAGRPPRGGREIGSRRSAQRVHPSSDFCRLGRQGSHSGGPGSPGFPRRGARRPGPQLPGVRPASWRSASEGSSQEGRLAGIAAAI